MVGFGGIGGCSASGGRECQVQAGRDMVEELGAAWMGRELRGEVHHIIVTCTGSLVCMSRCKDGSKPEDEMHGLPPLDEYNETPAQFTSYFEAVDLLGSAVKGR